ncbi:replication-relaxation family protein [Heyndrickxia camelliae]|uniref:Replication-relaxation n=1 Tax=Heyndrickxia camelliae TaxID=1707093 RepID=A0A2N3LNH7_9BACI|nr:replication-relaxation family protein [Heyndrickxia camelliae]PKR86084.1 hypothetical protein CWO92_06850 [Heyndrickxia camelliae]
MLPQTERKRQRHEAILLTLDKLEFVTKGQLQAIHNLGGGKNAYRILKEIKEEGYIQCKRIVENIYYLTKEGRELIGSTKDVKWNQNVEHTLMRNDLYVLLGCPDNWKNEPQVKVKVKDGLSHKEINFRPDARFYQKGVHHFVEIDNVQSMGENKKKLQIYYEVKEAFKMQFGHDPKIIFFTKSELRKRRLAEWGEGLNLHIYIK